MMSVQLPTSPTVASLCVEGDAFVIGGGEARTDRPHIVGAGRSIGALA